MRQKHCLTQNMARKMKNVENEKHTLQDLDHGEKPEKTWKMRHTHTVGPGLWGENSKTWKMSQKHCRTQNIARKSEKHEKGEIHTVGP